jgi:tRNA pseudouridine55 synthase
MTTSSGLLLVDKPPGLTSHDVVARVRRIIGERRVGHAGTLDPMATGLLIIAVGSSTRLLRFAQSEVKRYRGVVQLGVATDSLDADGAVTQECPVPALTILQMADAASAMLGPQLQTPPMVSALKVGGKRLYELAREGVEVEREAREITVSEFTILETDDPSRWAFEVESTVGTYVRVLLSDLSERVGTVGHLTELRRLSSGAHHVDDALTLRQVDEMVEAGRSPLHPPSCFVSHLESVVLSIDQVRAMRLGQQVELSNEYADDEIAAKDESGDLVGILRRRGAKWQPEVVLAASTDLAHG